MAPLQQDFVGVFVVIRFRIFPFNDAVAVLD
jgi:hypothetical protein